LCEDLRRSGFLSPAFVNPNLREERQKMLLASRGVHRLSMLQPIAHEMLCQCSPDGEALTIDFGAGALVSREVSLDGLGMSDVGRDKVLGEDVRSGARSNIDSTSGLSVESHVKEGTLARSSSEDSEPPK